MKTTRTIAMILIVTETRETPSSTFPAAPAAADTDGAEVTELALPPLAKVLPFAPRRRLAAGER
jgi:hypothetical protein